MENASKALLIAAAVLVTIIIITIGIKVYTSSSETGKVATSTGKTISDKAGEATDLAVSEITGSIPVTESNIIKYLSKSYNSYKSEGSVGDVSEYIKNNLKRYFKENIKEVSETGNKIIVKVNINGSDKKYELNKNNGNAGEYTYIDPFDYKGKTKETIQPGDDITLGTESFKVFSVSNDKIKAIPYYNLKISETPIKQATKQDGDKGAGTIAFSSDIYWTRETQNIDMNNSLNNIQYYINLYKKTIQSIGAEGIEIRIAYESELCADGITNRMRNPGLRGEFWVGSYNSNMSSYGGVTTIISNRG